MGKACSLLYAEEGASLILIDLNQGSIDGVAAQINDLGQEAIAIAADVSAPDQVRSAAEEGLARFGKVDVLVNNAGHQGPGSPVWEVDPEGWRRTIDVNLWGTFLFCREVVPSMIKRRAGRIINVSSGAGNHPMPFFSGYAAAKAAVSHFTRTIAEELKPYGITANAMGVRGITRMWRDVLDAGPSGGTTTASIRSQYEGGMRPAVEENMPVFLFLASDEAQHVTGQYLEANSLPSYLIEDEKDK
jgi:NAD(P)-dependent dehydrogenase (short-subunit alcohol dehydrogenase family)